MKILVVEDHPALREIMVDFLNHRGFVVDAVETAEGANGVMEVTIYDAVVLDLGLPDADGMSILNKAQSHRSGPIPTLIVTARDALADRVRGLNSGADDYVIKPFDLVELEARIRAVLRRPGSRRCTLLKCGSLEFDTSRREATIAGKSIELTRRETDLLDILLRAAGQIVIRDVLEERLYTLDRPVTPNALEATLSRLRKRLADGNVRIETRRGIGYRLVADRDLAP